MVARKSVTDGGADGGPDAPSSSSATMVADPYAEAEPPRALLYDLIRVREWHLDGHRAPLPPAAAAAATAGLPDWLVADATHNLGQGASPHNAAGAASAATTPSLPQPLSGGGCARGASSFTWKSSWTRETGRLAILSDFLLEIYPANAWMATVPQSSISTLEPDSPPAAVDPIGLWALPDREEPRDHGLEAFRQVAWSADGALVAVVTGDGEIHVLRCEPELHLVASLDLRASAANKAKGGAARGRQVADPVRFVGLHPDRAPEPSSKTETAESYRLLTVTARGIVRMFRVRTSAPNGSDSDPGDEGTEQSAEPLHQFSVAPWFQWIASCAWDPASCALFVAGEWRRGPLSKSSSAVAPAESEEVPVLVLFVSESIQAHASVPLPPKRDGEGRNPVAALLGSLFDISRAVSLRMIGVYSELPQEETAHDAPGLQVSLWSPPPAPGDSATERLDKTLVLLRNTHGHLLVLNGQLQMRDRFDAAFLKLAHQGAPLASAAWWEGALAGSGVGAVASAAAASPDGKPTTTSKYAPAIMTCDVKGCVIVHSYPSFATLSASEEFAPLLSVTRAHHGRAFILYCEVEPETRPQIMVQPKRKRGFLARSLRSVTNTLLWHFDDDEDAEGPLMRSGQQGAGGDKSLGPMTPPRHFYLYDWRPLTPQEMLLRYLVVDRDYTRALDLAKVHHLDTDVVYQTQWHHLGERAQAGGAAVRLSDIPDILGHVKDATWVLDACIETVPGTTEAARALLQHGIDLTKRAEEWAATVCAEGIAQHVAHSAMMELVEYRLILVRLRDCADLYARIHGSAAAAETAAGSGGGTPLWRDPQFLRLRNGNLVDTACEYAKVGNIHALGVLFDAVARLSLFRMHILSHLPLFLDPAALDRLLPGAQNAAWSTLEHRQGPAKDWRDDDWAEVPELMEAVEWKDDLTLAMAKLAPSERDVDAKKIAEWYIDRARQVEQATGCADLALSLLKMAQARKVQGLGNVPTMMETLCAFVYEMAPMIVFDSEEHPDWIYLTLADLEAMTPTQGIQLFLQFIGELIAQQPKSPEPKEAAFLAQSPGAIDSERDFPESPSGILTRSFERAAERYLVPYISGKNAHLALLESLSAVFESRPRFALRILAVDDLWSTDYESLQPESTKGEPSAEAEHNDVKVLFAERVLQMVYSLKKVNKQWIGALRRLLEMLPSFSNETELEKSADADLPHEGTEGGEGSPTSPQTVVAPGDYYPPLKSSPGPSHRRNQVQRRIQEYKAHVLACELLSRVNLYISPAEFQEIAMAVSLEAPPKSGGQAEPASASRLKSISGFLQSLASPASTEGTATTWKQGQPSLMREFFRRVTPADTEWVCEAVNDLLAIQFFRIPESDVYALLLAHVLKCKDKKVAERIALHLDPGLEALQMSSRVAIQAASELADDGKYEDAIKCLTLLPFTGVQEELDKMQALAILHEQGVTPLSRNMSAVELITSAMSINLPGPMLVNVGEYLQLEHVDILAIMAHNAGMVRAFEVCDDLLNLASSPKAPIDKITTALLDVVDRFPLHTRSTTLLRFCIERAPDNQLPQVLDLWKSLQAQQSGRSATRAASDTGGARVKVVPPFYRGMDRGDAAPTRQEIADWLDQDEPGTEFCSNIDCNQRLADAYSLPAALSFMTKCDRQSLGVDHHDMLIYVYAKEMLQRALVKYDESNPGQIPSGQLYSGQYATSTKRSVVAEFGELAATNVAEPHAVALAEEIRILQNQSVLRRLSHYEDVDMPKFLEDHLYQTSILRRFCAEDIDTASALAEQVHFPVHKLFIAWLQINVPKVSAIASVAKPRQWSQWVSHVQEDPASSSDVLFALREMLQRGFGPYPQHFLYDVTANIKPEHSDQLRVRQALIEAVIRSKFAIDSPHIVVAQLLAGNREFFWALFRAHVKSNEAYTVMKAEVLPHFDDIQEIPCIDHVSEGSKVISTRELVSCLSSVYLRTILVSAMEATSPVESGWDDDFADWAPQPKSAITDGLTDPLQTLVTLLKNTLPVDFEAAQVDVVRYLRSRMGGARVEDMERAIAVLDQFPKKNNVPESTAALREALNLWKELRKDEVHSSFVDRLLSEMPTNAIQELLLEGRPVAQIKRYISHLVPLQRRLSWLDPSPSAKAHDLPESLTYSDQDFLKDVRQGLVQIYAGGFHIVPVVQSLANGGPEYLPILMQVTADVAPNQMDRVTEMLSGSSPELVCKANAAAAESGLRAEALNMQLDELHQQWMDICASGPTRAHEERLHCLMSWTQLLSEARVAAYWSQEIRWLQQQPLAWLVNMRLQDARFSLELDQSLAHIFEEGGSPFHCIAFCLTSPHMVVLEMGEGLLQDQVSCAVDGGKLVNNLGPLLPVLRARPELSKAAQQFTWNIHFLTTRLLKEYYRLHPSLWAAALAGQLPLKAQPCAPPAGKSVATSLKLELDPATQWSLLISKYL